MIQHEQSFCGIVDTMYVQNGTYRAHCGKNKFDADEGRSVIPAQ